MHRIIIAAALFLALGVSACGGDTEVAAKPVKAVDPNVQRRADLNVEVQEVATSIYNITDKHADDSYIDICTESLPMVEAKLDHLGDLLEKLDAADESAAKMKRHRRLHSRVEGLAGSIDASCAALGV